MASISIYIALRLAAISFGGNKRTVRQAETQTHVIF